MCANFGFGALVSSIVETPRAVYITAIISRNGEREFKPRHGEAGTGEPALAGGQPCSSVIGDNAGSPKLARGTANTHCAVPNSGTAGPKQPPIEPVHAPRLPRCSVAPAGRAGRRRGAVAGTGLA